MLSEQGLFLFIQLYFLHFRFFYFNCYLVLCFFFLLLFFFQSTQEHFLIPLQWGVNSTAESSPLLALQTRLGRGGSSHGCVRREGWRAFPASLLYLDKGLFAQFYHRVGTDHVNIKLHVHMDRRACTQSWLSVQLQGQSHISEHLQKRKPELLNSPGGDGVCSYIQDHLAQEQFYLRVTI